MDANMRRYNNPEGYAREREAQLAQTNPDQVKLMEMMGFEYNSISFDGSITYNKWCASTTGTMAMQAVVVLPQKAPGSVAIVLQHMYHAGYSEGRKDIQDDIKRVLNLK